MTPELSLLLFWLKKGFALLLLPPLLPLLPIALGLLLVRRRRRAGLALAWSGVALNLLLVHPVSVGWLLDGLEAEHALEAARAREAQAIVILGAGKRSFAPEYGGETINRLALERLRYGARLARTTGLPVLVAGGAPSGDTPEASLMQVALQEDFGINARWVEGASRDTRENAAFAAVPLHAAGIERILLVTHAAHMPRAQAEFEARGLQVIPAPTGWLGYHGAGGNEDNERMPALLPSQNSAYAGWFALHELLGLAAYRLSR